MCYDKPPARDATHDSLQCGHASSNQHLSCLCLFIMQTKNGETFVSETDTEVIPKLLKFAYDSMAAEQQQDSSNGTAQVPFPKVRTVGWAAAHASSSCNDSMLNGRGSCFTVKRFFCSSCACQHSRSWGHKTSWRHLHST